ncbi:Ig-like domain-containing protein [Halobacteriovorax sp.]|uniref:Ig-like domain-containing protein n=1 Tax=Halobacteriovorax sp. TaxID=2020862 RepID=UPI00356761B3
MTATGYYSDGSSLNISSAIEWSSNNTERVTIAGNKATAIGVGSVSITASLDAVSTSITLLPFSANLTGIELSVSSLELPSEGQAQLIVTATYDNGQSLDVTDSAIYSMDDSTVASVDDSVDFGMITANSTGTTNLNINYSGFTKILPIETTTTVITGLQVTPIIGSRAKGASQQFYATGNLDNGETIDLSSSVTWSSSNSEVLSISDEGLANLVNSGNVSVTANYGGFSNSVSYSVTEKLISSLDLTLSSESISTGVSAQATCIANYNDGSSEDVSDSVTFSVDNSELGIISNSQTTKGKITPISEGTLSIIAELSGVSVSKSLTITTASLISIAVETNESLISSGVNAYFRAIGTYDDDSIVEITDSVIWSISNSEYGSISNSTQDRGLFNNIFNGTSTSSLTITASIDSIDGALDVLLAPGTISSISISPQSAVMNTSQNIDFSAFANFSDGARVEITDIVTWESSDTSLTMVSNSLVDKGRVSSLAEGVVNITANYNGLSSSSSVVDVDNSQTPVVSDNGDGLLASYFSGNNFDNLEGQRIDSQIDFNWSRGTAPLGVGDNFSVRWTGQIKGKYTGDCQISSRSDDGFRVTIGGNSILDIWFPHAPRWDHNYSVPFVEGEKQDITVEFFENGGQAVAELYWLCPGDDNLEVIPTEYLYSN